MLNNFSKYFPVMCENLWMQGNGVVMFGLPPQWPRTVVGY
jgi:hypothetical protein